MVIAHIDGGRKWLSTMRARASGSRAGKEDTSPVILLQWDAPAVICPQVDFVLQLSRAAVVQSHVSANSWQTQDSGLCGPQRLQY